MFRDAVSLAPVKSTMWAWLTRYVRLDYDGVVGLEAWASGDSDAALDAFEAAFAPATN